MPEIKLTLATQRFLSGSKRARDEMKNLGQAAKDAAVEIKKLQNILDTFSLSIARDQILGFQRSARQNFKIVQDAADSLRLALKDIKLPSEAKLRALSQAKPRAVAAATGGTPAEQIQSVVPIFTDVSKYKRIKDQFKEIKAESYEIGLAQAAAAKESIRFVEAVSKIKTYVPAFSQMTAGVESLSNAMRSIGPTVKTTLGTVVPILTEIGLAEAAAAQESIRFVEAISRIRTYIPVFSETTAAVESVSNAMMAVATTTRELVGAYANVEASQARFLASLGEVGVVANLASSSAERLKERFGLVARGTAAANAAIQEARLAWKAGALTLKEFDLIAAKATAGIGRMTNAFRFLNASTILLVGPLSGVGARLIALGIIAREFNAEVAIMTGGVALLAYTIGKSVSSTVKFEQAMANIGVVTGKSGAALDAFGEDLLNLSASLGIPIDEITRIAQATAELGIEGRENILKFTSAMAQFARIGEQVNVSEITQQFGVLLSVTNTAPKNIEAVASAVLRLAQSFNATKAQVLESANAIGRATSGLGVSAVEAAAIGAALKSAGVEAEVGGTAIARVMYGIQEAARTGGDQFVQLVKIIGLSGNEIRRIAETDITQAFALFVAGLARLAREGKSAKDALKDFGFAGIREAKSILPLVANTGALAKALRDAGLSAAEASLLSKQFADASDTLGRKLETLGTNFRALQIKLGSELNPVLSFLIDRLVSLSQHTDALIAIANFFTIFAGLSVVILPALYALEKILALIKGIRAGTITAAAVIALFSHSWLLLGLAIAATIAGLAVAGAKIYDFASGASKSKKEIEDTKDAIESVTHSTDRFATALSETAAATGTSSPRLEDFLDAIRRVGDRIRTGIDDFDEFQIATDELSNALAAAAGAMGDLDDASLRLLARIAGIASQLKGGKLGAEETKLATERLDTAIEQFIDHIKKVRDSDIDKSPELKKFEIELKKINNDLVDIQGKLAGFAAGVSFSGLIDLDSLEKGRDLVRKYADAIRKMSDEDAKTEVQRQALKLVTSNLTQNQELLARQAGEVFSKTKQLNDVYNAAIGSLRSYSDRVFSLKEANQQLEPELLKVQVLIDQLRESGVLTGDAFSYIQARITEANESFKTLAIAEAFQGISEALRNTQIAAAALNPTFGNLAVGVVRLDVAIQSINSALNKLIERGIDPLNPAMQKLRGTLAELKITKTLSDQFVELQQTAEELALANEHLEPAVLKARIEIEHAYAAGEITSDAYRDFRVSVDALNASLQNLAFASGIQQFNESLRVSAETLALFNPELTQMERTAKLAEGSIGNLESVIKSGIENGWTPFDSRIQKATQSLVKFQGQLKATQIAQQGFEAAQKSLQDRGLLTPPGEGARPASGFLPETQRHQVALQALADAEEFRSLSTQALEQLLAGEKVIDSAFLAETGRVRLINTASEAAQRAAKAAAAGAKSASDFLTGSTDAAVEATTAAEQQAKKVQGLTEALLTSVNDLTNKLSEALTDKPIKPVVDQTALDAINAAFKELLKPEEKVITLKAETEEAKRKIDEATKDVGKAAEAKVDLNLPPEAIQKVQDQIPDPIKQVKVAVDADLTSFDNAIASIPDIVATRHIKVDPLTEGSPLMPTSYYFEKYLPRKLRGLEIEGPRVVSHFSGGTPSAEFSTKRFATRGGGDGGETGYKIDQLLVTSERHLQIAERTMNNIAQQTVVSQANLAAGMQTARASKATATKLGANVGATTLKQQERVLRITSGKRNAIVVAK